MPVQPRRRAADPVREHDSHPHSKPSHRARDMNAYRRGRRWREHSGLALPKHDAVNERTCRRATVAYGLLMLQKQYSSTPPEARKCSLSTMWL
jgi:hypothetical protein